MTLATLLTAHLDVDDPYRIAPTCYEGRVQLAPCRLYRVVDKGGEGV